ncbi:integrase core domain-containing protein [Nocardia sp. NPDC059239]|uniref:integrase core domain-containing protein n=1 Tax=unclassified Nocardia TaxID=2637762 RepID=UPI00368CD4E2
MSRKRVHPSRGRSRRRRRISVSAGRCRASTFNGRFGDEFLSCKVFHSLIEVQVLAEDWRIEYNSYRPHGSLGFLTQQAFRQQWSPTEFEQPLQLA